MCDTRNSTLAENIIAHMPPVVTAAIALNILHAAKFDGWTDESYKPSDKAIALANKIAESEDYCWAVPMARESGLVAWSASSKKRWLDDNKQSK